MLKTSPCYKDGKDCPKRNQTCHSTCPAYKTFRLEKDQESAAIRKKKSDQNMMDDVKFETIKRVKGGKAIQTARKK